MRTKTAITVLRPRDELRQLWEASEHRPEDVTATFKDAPGGRGTEIHVEFDRPRVKGMAKEAKVKDALRRFKAVVETGEIARSDGVPEGEKAERKLKQRPAQPLKDDELQKAGAA